MESNNKYKIITGSFSIESSEEGITDDGSLAQKIAETLVKKLAKYGVDEVDIDFKKSVKIKNFKVGDIVECIDHIDDGYTEIGDYNVIFPPPTYVKIVDIKEDGWMKYGVKVLKEIELPEELQGKQFRTAMSSYAKVKHLGNVIQSWWGGDNNIPQKYFDTIYWMSESYLKWIKDEDKK